MRYKVTVSRVQTAEKYIVATDRQAASEKIAAELARPYSYMGMWKDRVTDVDVVEAEEPKAFNPIAKDGTLLLTIKQAGALLGMSYGSLYSLVRTNGIEHVEVGSRLYMSREQVDRFIQAHTVR